MLGYLMSIVDEMGEVFAFDIFPADNDQFACRRAERWSSAAYGEADCVDQERADKTSATTMRLSDAAIHDAGDLAWRRQGEPNAATRWSGPFAVRQQRDPVSGMRLPCRVTCVGDRSAAGG